MSFSLSLSQTLFYFTLRHRQIQDYKEGMILFLLWVNNDNKTVMERNVLIMLISNNYFDLGPCDTPRAIITNKHRSHKYFITKISNYTHTRRVTSFIT